MYLAASRKLPQFVLGSNPISFYDVLRTRVWGGIAVNTKMTRDILESRLNCKYKGYLKYIGQQGIKSDYETLLTQLRTRVRVAAIDRILARYSGKDALRNGALTTSLLKQGQLFLLDATLDSDFVSFHFDGLQRIDGPSKLGSFHYIPVFFYEGRQPRKE
jgi:hypothetical protein